MVLCRKQVRLFGCDLDSLYPNPLGSHGKTVQSQVNCDAPDLELFPNFENAKCQYCVLEPGEMLFIPAFCWHQVILAAHQLDKECIFLSIFQVTALDTGISINMFYGDPGENVFISKMFRDPYRDHFHYWFLNIIEQNRYEQSFPKILSRLTEVIQHFFVKQWHETPSQAQVSISVSARIVTAVCPRCPV